MWISKNKVIFGRAQDTCGRVLGHVKNEMILEFYSKIIGPFVTYCFKH